MTDVVKAPTSVERLTMAQLMRKDRDLRILRSYVSMLREDPQRSRMKVMDQLMRRHKLYSTRGIYGALERAVKDPDTPGELVAEYKRLKRTRTH